MSKKCDTNREQWHGLLYTLHQPVYRVRIFNLYTQTQLSHNTFVTVNKHTVHISVIFELCITCSIIRVLDIMGANKNKLECRPMPNMMATLPNIGGTLCSMPQSLAEAHSWSTVQ